MVEAGIYLIDRHILRHKRNKQKRRCRSYIAIDADLDKGSDLDLEWDLNLFQIPV